MSRPSSASVTVLPWGCLILALHKEGWSGSLSHSRRPISGDTAVIGASNKTVNSNTGQGAAYVFLRKSEAWSQQRELTTLLARIYPFSCEVFPTQ
jgi:hypothetical protein